MNNIENLVKKLPEIYQKIYKHPEYDSSSSRGCDDRADAIIPIIKEYQKKTKKKKTKILDIGCAQGFYGFKLAEQGCDVKGIDFCPENIDLCKAIADENKIKISFEKVIFDKEFIDNIKNIDFDIVLVLSVFHHIAHEKGFDYAKDLMDSLSKKAKIVITELALKEEPLYWNDNLPQVYYDWVKDFAFYKEIQFFPTHLSGINRPLLFCSNSYVLCNGLLYPFEEFSDKSFKNGIKTFYKKYYLNKNILIKKTEKIPNDAHSEYVFKEACHEISILENYSDKISFFPKKVSFEKNEKSIIAVYQIKKGILLYDLINEKLDKERIISDVLDQLIELENNNLFHSDIRLWNVVCLPDGSSQLIDIGAIKKNVKRDCLQEFYGRCNISVFESFLIFVTDLLLKNNYSNISSGFYLLEKRFFDEKIPLNYKFFFMDVLFQQKRINFSKIKEIFQKRVVKKEPLQNVDQQYSFILQELMAIQKEHYVLVMDSFNKAKNFEDILEWHKEVIAKQAMDLSKLDDTLMAHAERERGHEKELSEYGRAIGWHWALFEEQEKWLSKHDNTLSIHEERLVDHDKELSGQSTILKAHDEKLANNDGVISNHGSAIAEHEKAIKAQEKLLAGHDSILGVLGDKAKNLEESIEQQRKILVEHDDILGAQEEKLEEHSNKLTGYGNTISEHERALGWHWALFEAQEGRLTGHERQLDALEEKSGSLGAELERQRAVLEEQGGVLTGQGGTIAEQEKKLSDHIRAIGWHWKLFEEQEKRLEKQNKEIADYGKEIAGLEKRVEEQEIKFEELMKDLQFLSKQIKRMYDFSIIHLYDRIRRNNKF